jgi:hypothetical protein
MPRGSFLPSPRPRDIGSATENAASNDYRESKESDVLEAWGRNMLGTVGFGRGTLSYGHQHNAVASPTSIARGSSLPWPLPNGSGRDPPAG